MTFANEEEFRNASFLEGTQMLSEFKDEFSLMLGKNEYVEGGLEVDVTDETITIWTVTSYSGCDDDHEEYTVPLSYLWTPNWKDVYHQALHEEAQSAAIRATKLHEERLAREEETRRQRYLTLKAEFEGEKL